MAYDSIGFLIQIYSVNVEKLERIPEHLVLHYIVTAPAR